MGWTPYRDNESSKFLVCIYFLCFDLLEIYVVPQVMTLCTSII